MAVGHYPILREILATLGKIVPYQTAAEVGGDGEQLLIQSFAGIVLVGIDVEHASAHGFEVVGFEECGTGNGDGLVSGTEQGKAVGHSLREKERFVGFEQPEDGQVEHVALAVSWETETRNRCHPAIAIVMAIAQIPSLHAHDAAFGIFVGDEQRGRIVEWPASAPAGSGNAATAYATPLYDCLVEPPLIEEKVLCLSIEHGMTHQRSEIFAVNGICLDCLPGCLDGHRLDTAPARRALLLVEIDAKAISQPSAGVGEAESQLLDDKVDRSAMRIAHEAAIAIA